MPSRPRTITPIEFAIASAIEAELRASLGDRVPLSSHPAAIAAQDRRRIARLARVTRQIRETERRRAHRIALQESMEAERIARAADQGDD